MQVSSFDTVPPSGNEKDVSKPATAASDAFAILLQNSFEFANNPELQRLADASGLARNISANRDSFADARTVDDQPAGEAVDFDDPAAAPDDLADDLADKPQEGEPDDTARPAETEPVPVELALAAGPLIVPGTQFSTSPQLSSGAQTAANGAAGAVTQAAGQLSIAAQPVAADPVAGVLPASQSNGASAKSGNAAALKNGGAGGALPATLSDSSQQFVSRPANTLAAAATLAAQTSKAVGPTDAANSSSGPNNGVPGSATGNLLLSDTGAKTTLQNNGQRGAAQGAPTIVGNAPDVAANSSNPPAAFAASLAANQTPLPSATAKPLPGVTRAASPPPLEPAGFGGQTPVAANAARPALPPSRPAPPPGALREQIAVQVQRAFAQGVDRINIQLKPAELGRLEIRLDIAQDGKVSALVTVERPETLELLQKDSRGLQQALQDAGLKTDSGGLNFNLRGGDTAPREQTADGGGTANSGDAANGEALAESQDQPARQRASNSLIDVEV